MKQTIELHDFRDAFRRFDRMENFSHEGLELLFEFCEECDPDMELDVIALCCDYSEESAADIFNTYPISCDSEEPTEKEVIEAVREYLEENTQLIGETSSGFVYACF